MLSDLVVPPGDDWLSRSETGPGGGEYTAYTVVCYFDAGATGREFPTNGAVTSSGKTWVVGAGNAWAYLGDVCDSTDASFDVRTDCVPSNHFDFRFKICYYCCCPAMFEYSALSVCATWLGVEPWAVIDTFDHTC